jgi:peptidylprolyl isomerase
MRSPIILLAFIPKSIKSKSMETAKFYGTSASVVAASLLISSSSPVLADESIDTAQYTTTDSGLKYLDLKEGTGEVPKPGDIVRVHYTGWLDGFESEKKFDSSYDRRSPLSFPVGAKRVIAGWDEGILTNLKVGGKRNLIIPPDLGYGSRGAGGVIPPNAVLYFTIELVGIGAR